MSKLTKLAGVLAVLGIAGYANANVTVYEAFLDGPSESPPNASPGTGFAEVTWDSSANTMRVQVTFSGLLGTTTASHIHAATPSPGTGTAEVATTTPTFPGFPLGVTAGAYDQTFDMTQASSYNAAYVTANGGTVATAEAALKAALDAETSYLNIHTNVVPGGEIRGFLIATVPEPASLSILALSGGMLLSRRRRA